MPDNPLVITPTYNEKENIVSLVYRIKKNNPDTHILVVDDSSPDGTAASVQHLIHTNQNLFLLQNSEKLGLKNAYLTGAKWAEEHGYTGIIIQMDADGSHRPEELPRLISVLQAKEADIVQGSRWVAGGAIEGWPKHRELLSKAGSLYANLLLHLKIKDTTGGYRIYKDLHTYENLLKAARSKGYGFQIETLYNAKQKKLNVVEEPIIFVERLNGVSKMTTKIMLEAIFQIAKIALSKPII